MFSFVFIVTRMDHKGLTVFETIVAGKWGFTEVAVQWIITETIHSYVNLTNNSTCTKIRDIFQGKDIEITYDNERPYFLIRYTFSTPIQNYRRGLPVLKIIETFYMSCVEFDKEYIDISLIRSPLHDFRDDITWITNGVFIFPHCCEIKAKLVPYDGTTMCYIHTFP